MSLLRNIATVGGITMISRILGFVRDILVAAVLGAGLLADVFFVAFKLPNLFRRLFAEGAFSAAFVPQFAGYLESHGKEVARVFAEQVLTVLLWLLVSFVIVLELAMPWVMLGFAPGFVRSPEQFDLAVLLTRITFPYLLFISLVSLLAGVLNSLGRFAAAAATPIILNLCLIGSILWLVRFTPTPAHALAWGVAAAGMVQFCWLLVHVLRAGVHLRLPFPRFTRSVYIMLTRIAPVAIGAGVYQISLLIDTMIASLLPAGSISYLFFADRVNQLPMGVVGVAVGTALLPLLSRQVRAGDEVGARYSQNRALEFSLFLALPAAVALVVIAGPVVTALFERGAFTAKDAAATAGALATYATGLPAYVLVKGLTPGFFAREDTVTPVKIGLLAVAVNLVLNLILMGPLLHIGIAVATSVSAWFNAALLIMILHRRGHFAVDVGLITRVPRMVIASALMGVVLLVSLGQMESLLAGVLLERILGLTGLVVIGLLVYGVLALVMRIATVDDLRRALSRRPASA
ncbi:MAG: murein biosynthesis integral membrane protein MurJ [Rhodospirillaceae bacterium]|nr:murein biosynthesis integral membrane protein MurJ [Rhodospirillaceae bacterium]